ncbi:hypothetical protein PR048_010368 [Dryococelus australis]|uniref:Tc1-like transposase DDE domain-containing protein n=1 Tax=Dryococelus australis TaxID=614101 RepID=A0ABQ9I3M2_9NEOP|nr:hypothetical protein PR048_010368 [Dryococelus australis]
MIFCYATVAILEIIVPTAIYQTNVGSVREQAFATLMYRTALPLDLCFTAFDVGPLVFVRGSMNTEGYCNILDNEMLPTLWRFYGMYPCYFQDDNARCHVSRATMQWYADNNVRRFDWPTQSPDLNPMEHIWDELDRRVRARQAWPKSIARLMEWLHEEWRRIPVDVLQTLIESIPDRVAAVIVAGGDLLQWGHALPNFGKRGTPTIGRRISADCNMRRRYLATPRGRRSLSPRDAGRSGGPQELAVTSAITTFVQQPPDTLQAAANEKVKGCGVQLGAILHYETLLQGLQMISALAALQTVEERASVILQVAKRSLHFVCMVIINFTIKITFQKNRIPTRNEYIGGSHLCRDTAQQIIYTLLNDKVKRPRSFLVLAVIHAPKFDKVLYADCFMLFSFLITLFTTQGFVVAYTCVSSDLKSLFLSTYLLCCAILQSYITRRPAASSGTIPTCDDSAAARRESNPIRLGDVTTPRGAKSTPTPPRAPPPLLFQPPRTLPRSGEPLSRTTPPRRARREGFYHVSSPGNNAQIKPSPCNPLFLHPIDWPCPRDSLPNPVNHPRLEAPHARQVIGPRFARAERRVFRRTSREAGLSTITEISVLADRSREILCTGISAHARKLPPVAAGPHPAPRACAAPTQAWIPGQITGFLQVEIVPGDAFVWRVFSGISRFPALSFRRRSIFTAITLIGSQDLAVKSRPLHRSFRHANPRVVPILNTNSRKALFTINAKPLKWRNTDAQKSQEGVSRHAQVCTSADALWLLALFQSSVTLLYARFWHRTDEYTEATMRVGAFDEGVRNCWLAALGGNPENPIITKSGDTVRHCSSESIVHTFKIKLHQPDCQSFKEYVTLSEDYVTSRAARGVGRNFEFVSLRLITSALERASQKQFSGIHKTPYDRVKRCRERKINIKSIGYSRVTTETLHALSVGAIRHLARVLLSPVLLPHFLTLDAQLHSPLNEACTAAERDWAAKAAIGAMTTSLSEWDEMIELRMQQHRHKRADETGDPRGKPADQRHRPARFPYEKIREWPGRGLNPVRFADVGGKKLNSVHDSVYNVHSYNRGPTANLKTHSNFASTYKITVPPKIWTGERIVLPRNPPLAPNSNATNLAQTLLRTLETKSCLFIGCYPYDNTGFNPGVPGAEGLGRDRVCKKGGKGKGINFRSRSSATKGPKWTAGRTPTITPLHFILTVSRVDIKSARGRGSELSATSTRMHISTAGVTTVLGGGGRGQGAEEYPFGMVTIPEILHPYLRRIIRNEVSTGSNNGQFARRNIFTSPNCCNESVLVWKQRAKENRASRKSANEARDVRRRHGMAEHQNTATGLTFLVRRRLVRGRLRACVLFSLNHQSNRLRWAHEHT